MSYQPSFTPNLDRRLVYDTTFISRPKTWGGTPATSKIYRFKQTAYEWNHQLSHVLLDYGFTQCADENCSFVYHTDTVYLAVDTHADDIAGITNITDEITRLVVLNRSCSRCCIDIYITDSHAQQDDDHKCRTIS